MLSQEKITSLFDSFSKLNVLIVGDVMIDAYVWGKVDRISPEAPVPIIAANKRESRLGGAANVALNVQTLGANPILCSVIGNDAKGYEFIDILKKQNLETHGICQSESRITTTKFRLIGNNVQLLRVDEEITSPLSGADEDLLINKVEDLIAKQKIDVIIFQDYDKGVLTPRTIGAITDLANTNNIPTTVDPKKRNFWEYKNVTLFKPNLKELKEGLDTNTNLTHWDNLAHELNQFCLKQSIRTGMVTLSEHGVMILDAKNGAIQKHHIPAHIRNIADVSGAGDTVISTASLCLALGLPPEELAYIANLSGGLVCEYVGVVPINKTQLQNELYRLVSC